MQTSDYIAILSIAVSLIVSIVGGIYAIVTSTKKYELAEQYKREVLEWYEKTILIITELLEMQEKSNKRVLLAQLSAMVEVGRFYFPNIQKKDGYGDSKSSAYRGYRHLALDFLVYIYEIMRREDCHLFEIQIRAMERQFTSLIFDCIDPQKRKKQLKKYADYVSSVDVTINDLANMKTEEAIEFWENMYGPKER